MNIVELQATNVKRLKAVRIRPDGSPLVIVGGENGQGKTSCIDAIFYALAGKGALPAKPVRSGTTEATITVDIGEFVITRSIYPDGKTELKVTTREGGRVAGPQTILDSLLGNLAFDPLAFARLDPKKQVEELQKVVGLNFTDLESRRAALAENRLVLGREARELTGHIRNLPEYHEAPPERVSGAALAQKLEVARQAKATVIEAQAALAEAEATVLEWDKEIGSLEEEIRMRQGDLAKAMESKAACEKARGERRVAVAELARKTPPNAEDQIIAQMREADEINRKVAANELRRDTLAKLSTKQAAHKDSDEKITAIDQEKAKALAEAKWPVPNLSFNENGLLVGGIPFDQASGAEQLRVSTAMALALNPKLKVLLVRDGSLLDAKSMEMLAQMAAGAGAQVWLERVSDKDPCAIIIEDGQVARVNPPGNPSETGSGFGFGADPDLKPGLTTPNDRGWKPK